MTITQFVDKWAPQEASRRIPFLKDVESLLLSQVEGLRELLNAVEGTERPS